MKKICFVNGSPRGEKSCSQYYIDSVKQLFDIEKNRTHVIISTASLKKKNNFEDFKIMAESENIIFSFPLYIDSIPSHFLEFLYQFEKYNKVSERNAINKLPRIYAIINNGFIEGHQNKNAARIMYHYASRIGLTWRFAIGIGAGEFMMTSKKNIPIQSKMKLCIHEAFLKLKKDIESNEVLCENNIFTNPKMPKKLFMFMGDRHWVQRARKNKIRKKELYNKPIK